MGLAWSPDGKTLVSSAEDRTTIWWDPAAGRVRHRRDFGSLSLAWSADGRTLATTWQLLTGQTGEVIRDLHAVPDDIWGVAFAPDGKTLLAAGLCGVQVLDVASGRPRGVFLSFREGGNVALQADGHWRGSPGIEKQLLYIAVTEAGQETLTYEEFSKKYGWKNEPDKVRLLGE
jgi:WD40 repeat protein